MSTDYSKWNKWSEEDAEKEVEKRWKVDALEDEASRSAAQLRDATAAVHQSTMRSAEALKSKAAVERLKAKSGPPGGRARREQQQAALAAKVPRPAAAPEEEQSSIGRLADTLGSISGALSDVLTRLNALKADTKTRSAASGSLAGGLELLRRLSGLGAQCVGLRREAVWATEEAAPCYTLMADVERSILSLYGEVTSMVSVLGLNLGEFAVAADMSRCMLKIAQMAQQGKSSGHGKHHHSHEGGKGKDTPVRHGEAIMFVVRGLAFLAMGHAHLCHVHLTQALDLHPRYPELAGLAARVEDEVAAEARAVTSRAAALQPFVMVDLRRVMRRQSAQASVIAPTRLESIDVRGTLNGGATDAEVDALTSEPAESLYMDEVQGDTAHSAVCVEGGCRTTDWLTALLPAPTPDLLPLQRRVFYEAQMLYLESVMRSAEIKYMSCLAMARCWLTQHAHLRSDGAGVAEVLAIVCAALVNAATCRSARQLRAPKHAAAFKPSSGAASEPLASALLKALPSVDALCEMPPVALIDLASDLLRLGAEIASVGHWYSSVALDMKRSLILERSNRISEAVLCLEGVERRLRAAEQKDGAGAALFVSEYPSGRLLTQSCMSGSVCVPVDYSSEAFKDGATPVKQVLDALSCGAPSSELILTQIGDVAVKLAKLRMQLPSL